MNHGCKHLITVASCLLCVCCYRSGRWLWGNASSLFHPFHFLPFAYVHSNVAYILKANIIIHLKRTGCRDVSPQPLKYVRLCVCVCAYYCSDKAFSEHACHKNHVC